MGFFQPENPGRFKKPVEGKVVLSWLDIGFLYVLKGLSHFFKSFFLYIPRWCKILVHQLYTWKYPITILRVFIPVSWSKRLFESFIVGKCSNLLKWCFLGGHVVGNTCYVWRFVNINTPNNLSHFNLQIVHATMKGLSRVAMRSHSWQPWHGYE